MSVKLSPTAAALQTCVALITGGNAEIYTENGRHYARRLGYQARSRCCQHCALAQLVALLASYVKCWVT